MTAPFERLSHASGDDGCSSPRCLTRIHRGEDYIRTRDASYHVACHAVLIAEALARVDAELVPLRKLGVAVYVDGGIALVPVTVAAEVS